MLCQDCVIPHNCCLCLLTVRKQLSSNREVHCLPTNQPSYAQVQMNCPVYAEQQGNDTQPEIACRVLSDNSTELMQTCSFVCTATFQASKYSQQECSSHSNRRSLFTDHQAVSCLQAESVNELVVARTAAAADSALAGLTGGIGATVQRLRLSALTLLAELEVWVAKSACCCCA